MALTTATAARTQYLANLTYDVEGSASKCLLFIEAARALLVLTPKHAKTGRNAEIDFDVGQIQIELTKAQRWYASRGGESGTDSGVGYYGLSEARR